MARLTTSETAWLLGDVNNLQLGGDGLRLGGDLSYRQAGRNFGVFVSRVQPVDRTFDLVRAQARFEGEASNLLLEARSSTDLERWSSWSPVGLDGAAAALPPGRFFQYRLELSGGATEAPLVQALDFELASSGLLIAAASSENPTVRVLGSREGLVGHRTANGHIIKERDEFAALPSRRALNPLGKQDYRVKISYKGRSATVPVWDVGPWNSRDNYWDAKRDLFVDLPRFQPQAYAAWAHDHNGGRDQYDRWVSFPASVDIADGTFIQDLKMTKSDWVDVTFLWVEAPSPSVGELPPFVSLKPEPKKQETSTAQSSRRDGGTSSESSRAATAQDPRPSDVDQALALLHPAGAEAGDSASAGAGTAPGATSPSRYTVVDGDSVSSIARRFGLTPEAVLRANQLDDPNRLQVGQQLLLPRPDEGGSSDALRKGTEGRP